MIQSGFLVNGTFRNNTIWSGPGLMEFQCVDCESAFIKSCNKPWKILIIISVVMFLHATRLAAYFHYEGAEAAALEIVKCKPNCQRSAVFDRFIYTEDGRKFLRSHRREEKEAEIKAKLEAMEVFEEKKEAEIGPSWRYESKAL